MFARKMFCRSARAVRRTEFEIFFFTIYINELGLMNNTNKNVALNQKEFRINFMIAI